MSTTPMMLQWQMCKKKADGALLLFRLGDFYEAFEEDAIVLARELDLVLTQRQDIPMAGIPVHTCDTYIDRLVGKGYRIAIAEQMEDPKQGKGIVPREVVRVLTPGSLITSSLLQEKVNNFLTSIAQVNEVFGIAVLDVTTADFRVMEFEHPQEVHNTLCRLSPKEVIVSEKCWSLIPQPLPISSIQIKGEYAFAHRSAYETLLRHFRLHTLDGLGLRGMTAGIGAAGALLSYVQDDLSIQLTHVETITVQTPSDYMHIDSATQRHLELIQPLHMGGTTLLQVLDQTLTPMGGRLLKEWILHPLLLPEEIQVRQSYVEKFLSPTPLKTLLQEVRDLERLCMRIETGYASPRDLVALRYSLEPLPKISEVLSSLSIRPLEDFSAVAEHIKRALLDHPPVKITEGTIFKSGYSPELDALHAIKGNSQTWLVSYQTQLREELQIKTLKIGYTQAFGYYIEVSRGQSGKMPPSFQRKQTLLHSERFISPQLQQFEHKILRAEDQIGDLEQRLFQEFRQEIALSCSAIRAAARWIAQIDVFHSFALTARTHQYCCPTLHSGYEIEIIDGRHPVIAASLNRDEFTPNSTRFDEAEQLHLITGPNMAGKSTFIRQTALIVLLAQIGSYVPAKIAHIGVIDKLFTRIGASDDVSRGQSTFMVEMSETANILHHVTQRSLVILDEIGRGTSTYDGIAIAWAVSEDLLAKHCKTLFATHYFELTQLEKECSGVINYHVAVQELEDRVVFLRKIVRGKTDKSYGIHVAKLAGLPSHVVRRAEEMLKKLHAPTNRRSPIHRAMGVQLELF